MSALYIRLLSLYRHGWASLPARSGCGSQKVLGFGAERIEDGEGDKVGQLQKQKDLYDMFNFQLNLDNIHSVLLLFRLRLLSAFRDCLRNPPFRQFNLSSSSGSPAAPAIGRPWSGDHLTVRKQPRQLILDNKVSGSQLFGIAEREKYFGSAHVVLTRSLLRQPSRILRGQDLLCPPGHTKHTNQNGIFRPDPPAPLTPTQGQAGGGADSPSKQHAIVLSGPADVFSLFGFSKHAACSPR